MSVPEDKTKKIVDITNTVPVMRMHELADFPVENFQLSLSGVELEFVLSTLTRVHTTLIDRMRDKTISSDERKAAYDFAINTENMYATIFNQLKLFSPQRKDLH
jgi:hypothetical protein